MVHRVFLWFHFKETDVISTSVTAENALTG